MPTSVTTPASTASGRSVTSRMTSTGVGEDDVGALHQPHEAQVVLRRHQVHVVEMAEVGVHRALHVRVQMHRVQHLQVRPPCQFSQRTADVLEALPEALAAVAGDQQQATIGVKHVEGFVSPRTQRRVGIQALYGLLQGIDDGVAGDQDLPAQVFTGQVGARAGRGRVQLVADHIDHPPVHFLRPRPVDVTGAQSGLDMTDRNAVVVSPCTSTRSGRTCV